MSNHTHSESQRKSKRRHPRHELEYPNVYIMRLLIASIPSFAPEPVSHTNENTQRATPTQAKDETK